MVVFKAELSGHVNEAERVRLDFVSRGSEAEDIMVSKGRVLVGLLKGLMSAERFFKGLFVKRFLSRTRIGFLDCNSSGNVPIYCDRLTILALTGVIFPEIRERFRVLAGGFLGFITGLNLLKFV